MSIPPLAKPSQDPASRRTVVKKAMTWHQEKTEETRNALMKSARLIFARDGFEACRLEDVATAAGYTRGAFYAHYKTKEELFFALMQEEVNQHAERIRTLLAKPNNAKGRLKALRDYYISCIGNREWGMLMLEFKLFAIRHPKLHAKLAATHRRIRTSMKLDGVDELLGIQESDAERRRPVLEGVMAGLFLEHSFDPECLSEGEAASFLGNVFDLIVLPK